MNVVLTFRLSPEIQARLDKLADETGRKEPVLAIEALGGYLEEEVRQIAGIQAGNSEVEHGDVPTAAQMRRLQQKGLHRVKQSQTEISDGPGGEARPCGDDELLDTAQMATLLGLSPTTLETWRSTKRYALEYIKVGRLVRYRRSEADKFLESRTVK